MAVGVAKTLGFNLINNFKRPYFAATVTEFWKRWHISLTRWLTQQVYIPLGGSRFSKSRNYWNILVTFFVSGVWHGANWTFILWGILHGICQIIEKYLGWNKKEYTGFSRFARVLVTFIIVTLGWTIFRSPSITDAFGFFSRFTSMSGKLLAEGSVLVYIVLAVIPVFTYELICEYSPSLYSKLYSRQWIRWSAYLAVFSMILLMGVFDGSSFIYVSF